MAAKQHSNSRKTRNSVQAASNRSEWAAWMTGADPEWLQGQEAKALAQVFGGRFPAWLIESEPWRPVTAGRFKCLRKDLLGLTVEQCAAYLHLHRSTVSRWEADSLDVPRAAYEALRLLYSAAAQRLSHKHWDGWFINRKTGELVSPDVGRLAVKPDEINGLPALYNRLAILQQYVEKLEGKVDALEAENTAMRSDEKSRQVAAELEAMQERISDLLASVRTAEIIEFNRPADEPRRASR